MKLHKKRLKWIIIAATLITLLIWTWFLYSVIKCILPFDISQDYRKIKGIDNIVFATNWEHQCYKRCFWGLKKTENFQDNFTDIFMEPDDSISELMNFIDTDNEIFKSVYSPDKNYILYCEIDYDYYHSGITDDEYCYYRVYEIKTDTVVTIYQGYRKWYDFCWVD